MLHPFALKFHGGSRKSIGLVYRYGFQLVGLVEGTHPEYRPAVFAVVIGDPLYNAREFFHPLSVFCACENAFCCATHAAARHFVYFYKIPGRGVAPVKLVIITIPVWWF